MSEAALKALTRGALADLWGARVKRADKIDGEIKACRDEFNRRDLTAIKGEKFLIVKTVKAVKTIDSKGIREEMGDAWADARSKDGLRTTYDVQPVGLGAKVKK